MLVAQRTQLINGLRGHLSEIGVIAAQGHKAARELAKRIEPAMSSSRGASARRWPRWLFNCASSTKPSTKSTDP